MKRNAKSNIYVYIEALRIISCFLVLYNHTIGYHLYLQRYNGIKQFVYMTLSMITRVNVPIFFMISGSLLLRKNNEIRGVLKKILKIIYGIVIFDVVIIIANYIAGNQTKYTIYTLFNEIIRGEIANAGAQWYLYSYIGFLLSVPFLQRVAQKIKKEEYLIILGLFFIIRSLIPIINILCIKNGYKTISLSSNFEIPFVTTKSFFFPLIGYYIDNKIDINKIKKEHILQIIFLGIIGILLSNYCTYQDAIINDVFSQNYVQLFDYLSAIVVFILIKYIFVVKLQSSINGSVIEKTIIFIGSLTYGIYMIDPIFHILFYKQIVEFCHLYVPRIIASLIYIIFSMTLGGIITVILKKIPYIKEIL